MSQPDFSAVSPGKSLRPHPVKISKLSTILLDPTTLTLWQYMPPRCMIGITPDFAKLTYIGN